VTSLEVPTSQGLALIDWSPATGAGLGPAAAGPGAGATVPFVMALTHGAGGTVNAPALRAARDAALALGGGVALVTQPYRVCGARAPGNADRQDEAWTEIMTWLLSADGPTPPGARALIVGGRSNGARVACRTAAAVGALGVLALAFPLQPPARRTRGSDEVTFPPDRSPELEMAARGGAHVLVLNGDRDPFGIPAASGTIRVNVLNGETHSLSKKPAAVTAAVAKWLADLALPVA
jgi:predicted alpha/beta-hydrolase family hydrolase